VKWGVGTETEPKLHFRSVSVPKPKPNFGRSLSEVRIFELRFNYSYSNSNAGNLIFVCKGAKGFNSRWRVVYGDGEPPTMCHCTHWAGEEWEVRQRSLYSLGRARVGSTAAVIQWQDRHQVAPSTRCYRRINYSMHDWSGGTTGCLVNMSPTTWRWATASDRGYCLWSGSLVIGGNGWQWATPQVGDGRWRAHVDAHYVNAARSQRLVRWRHEVPI